MLVQKYIRTFSKDYIRSWFYTNLEKYKLIAIAMHCTCCGCSKYKTNKNIFLAFFSCNFYVNTKWNSLPIFQIPIFFWRHRFAAFKNALEVPFPASSTMLKSKALWWTFGWLNQPHEHGFTHRCVWNICLPF